MTADEQLRLNLATRLRSSGVASLRELAATISNPSALPCWGGIATVAGRLVTSEADRVELTKALLDLGDARCLLLQLAIQRGHELVLRALLDDINRVPSVVQCALATLPEVEPLLTPARIAALHPAARRLREAPPAQREVERQFYAGLQQVLLVQIAPVASPNTKIPNANGNVGVR